MRKTEVKFSGLLRFSLIVAAVLAVPQLCNAQPPSFVETFTDLPVDGGITLLIAAGIGYGAKKLYSSKAPKK
jgi:hypothetical protein